ncbi:glycerol-3-phosphate dehydrogenase [Devosia insulae DS-56]|uniref:Glycerol-3-phosphate dehydrogenase n=1 Tax=Devosia insulae DS-56 TaxID=1116389 RepID=A0A1E5XLQ1_9HYPH|nr:glycerol-3-phosphate dehydrogenase [Devosia insulae]OEO29530.1 glycerol-3-phosphate dehydrogenase [Devosia insulae DS-56]
MSDAQEPFDVFVIGGGVNGTGIARDAMGRGHTVMLAEMHDLASGTSSAATKLVHGGLRYLEHYEFRLVHESLAEREVLWASAPHIIWPLRFVLPYEKNLRPAWLLRLGLFVYDHLGGRKLLPGTKTLDLSTDPAGRPLKPGHKVAFEYSDGWVDDARLVALNARDAADKGARVVTQTKVTAARREGGLWRIELQGPHGTETVSARLLVNAGGPWVDQVIRETVGRNEAHHVRLVKGSHIVVKKLFDHDRCYFFQNADGRIFFAIPYEGDYTLIGTTDQDFEGDPTGVKISDAETDYLCAAASEYFIKPVTRDEIVWTYAGVRPLFDDGASAAQEATRDYVLKTEGEAGNGPLINVFGGKLTTHRRLSEQVVDKIDGLIGRKGPRWTKSAHLPGGNFPPTAFDAEVRKLAAKKQNLDPAFIRRLVRAYGTLAADVLGEAQTPAELGEHFGTTLYAREVDYLMDLEWARTADDVLWRRSKQGLKFKANEKAALARYMAERLTEMGKRQ